jgi:simple sugar transport system permease protein
LSQIFFGVKGVLGLEQQIGFQINLSGWLVILVVLSLCLVLLFWWILTFRRPGIAVRMISSHLQGAREFGLPVRRFQFFSLLISGVLGGLAGSILVFKLGAYVPNMSAGRGWIALVVVFLGNTSPVGVLIGSLLFVGAEYIAGEAQAAASVPGLFVGLPYLITFIALVLWSALRKRLSK